MASVDPLSELRDLHLPPAPDGASILPLVIPAGLLLLLALGGVMLLMQLRKGWLREVERGLCELGREPPGTALPRAAQLLRRAALAKHGPEAAKLTGEAWLAALDRLFGTDFFRGGAGRVFGDALYRGRTSPGEASMALAGLRRLVRRRRLAPW